MEALSGPARKRKDRDAAAGGSSPAEPAVGVGNRLLPGCLAHEFLSSGTVLGERLGPGAGAEASEAVLVQRGGARVPRVVNPAQLAAWAGR
ncbi:uncharacterized protein LOC133903019 [Phragmites australis]|uniref:uncharacterized protein LOC133903019 n=1 Tax=Phragmites australis TaxID=29695 RepID=UPI002D7A3243|nr:uncharacterized protein LOC133903019 [Phragmites australis]